MAKGNGNSSGTRTVQVGSQSYVQRLTTHAALVQAGWQPAPPPKGMLPRPVPGRTGGGACTAHHYHSPAGCTAAQNLACYGYGSGAGATASYAQAMAVWLNTTTKGQPLLPAGHKAAVYSKQMAVPKQPPGGKTSPKWHIAYRLAFVPA